MSHVLLKGIGGVRTDATCYTVCADIVKMLHVTFWDMMVGDRHDVTYYVMLVALTWKDVTCYGLGFG